MAATFVSGAYGGPAVLFALLLGMAFNFISTESRLASGIAFSASSILRIGVAALGARITVEQVFQLGWSTLAGLAATVALTIGFGIAAARLLRLKTHFGILTAGAVAICGASAAAAIAAVLPRHENHERDTAFTIIAVTTLSTIAMVIYPFIGRFFSFSHTETGIFLGGTIHDVAQVVGAGFSVSPETGEVATIVKLLRVALLVPSVLVISVLVRRVQPEKDTTAKPPALVPGFLVAFVGIVVLNSFHLIPPLVQTALTDLSRWCIVVAIAALGVKTSLVALANVGHQAMALIVAETAFIALLVLVLVHIG